MMVNHQSEQIANANHAPFVVILIVASKTGNLSLDFQVDSFA